MVEIKHNPLLIYQRKIICEGVFCSGTNDFFALGNSLVRNKSPPSMFEFSKI